MYYVIGKAINWSRGEILAKKCVTVESKDEGEKVAKNIINAYEKMFGYVYIFVGLFNDPYENDMLDWYRDC